MTLLTQSFAAVLAAALLARRARVAGTARTVQGMVVALAVALLTFLAVGSVWSASQGLWNARKSYASVPPAQVPLVAGETVGANVPFVEWLGGLIPVGDSYSILGPDEATYQWATFRLYPRVVPAAIKDAHWIVFDGTTIKDAGFKRTDFSRVLRFGDGLLLGERTG